MAIAAGLPCSVFAARPPFLASFQLPPLYWMLLAAHAGLLRRAIAGSESVATETIMDFNEMSARLCLTVVFLAATSPFAHPRPKALAKSSRRICKRKTISLESPDSGQRIANPYQLQAEMGLTNWGEVAVFHGFRPEQWIFETEIRILRKEPYLSPSEPELVAHLDVDPQPYIEAGYYTEHHKFIAGAIHAGYKNEAILGYAYDFNKTWRVQLDFQSGAENSSTIGFTAPVALQLHPPRPVLVAAIGPRRQDGRSSGACTPLPATSASCASSSPTGSRSSSRGVRITRPYSGHRSTSTRRSSPSRTCPCQRIAGDGGRSTRGRRAD